MANRKKKRKPKNSNAKKKIQPKPLVIIQERSDNKGAWMIEVDQEI